MRGDTVFIPEHSIVAQKLRTMILSEESFRFEMISAGRVKAIPNLYAEIAPPFSGRVTKVYLKLGMKTRPGTPLFEIVSPEFIEAQKLFFQAKAELQAAQLKLRRQQDLKANGVGSEREFEEAEAEYAVEEKDYQNAVAALKVFGVDVNNLVFGQPLVITSPIHGEVIDNEIVNGHYIKAEDPPHAKVAELSKVWVVGMVKEKDIRFLYQIDSAEIFVAAYPGRVIVGKIYHINELVDEETRSVQVLVECQNADRALKPGMYVTVKFIDKPTRALFVPAKAVLQLDDKSFVFVQTAKGEYVRRFVETGVTDSQGRIQILSGLRAGEVVLSDGAFYLLEAK
ncbi:MAG: efflux RND transporter periplasmic adaptor subunit [Candidatus Kapabacteria bacterium]|nr:efflux RND transporter periplasmic adaptor subunit [Candidatus Kapabacteria bacterium]